MLNNLMIRFSDWFGSTSGVVETFAATFSVVIIEHLFPGIDPNGFLLLYWLTVYSGVTQPIIAFASAVSTKKSDEALSRIERMEQDQRQLIQNQTDMLKTLLIIAERESEIEKAHHAHVSATKHKKD